MYAHRSPKQFQISDVETASVLCVTLRGQPAYSLRYSLPASLPSLARMYDEYDTAVR